MTWNGCPTLGVLGDPRVRLTSAVRRLFVKHYLRALRCLSALLLPPTACQHAGGGCSWMPFAFLPVSDPWSCFYVAHVRRGKALVWLSTDAIWGALEHFGNVSGCGARASGGGQRFCFRSGATFRGEGFCYFWRGWRDQAPARILGKRCNADTGCGGGRAHGGQGRRQNRCTDPSQVRPVRVFHCSALARYD